MSAVQTVEVKERPIKTIPLTQGKEAIVDAADFEWLSKYRWYFNGGYAFTRLPSGGKTRPFAMHALIMDTPKGKHTDHINHNTLDNRRSNLRVCTPKENLNNRRSYSGSNNPFHGKTHSEEVKNKVKERWAKPVLQFSISGEFVREWPSTAEVQRALGISNGNISSACLGRLKTAGGYKWQYKSK